MTRYGLVLIILFAGTLCFGILFITKEPKLKHGYLKPNKTIRVKNFECYGTIIDSMNGIHKVYYKLRYQTNTGQIISDWFEDNELDTIPWTNYK